MKELPVRRGKENVGRLVEDGTGLRFRYLSDAERAEALDGLAAAGVIPGGFAGKPSPISAALPVDNAVRSGTFFANLLPEGELRERVAARVGGGDFTLLGAIAYDCAGAYSVVDPAAPDAQLSAGRKPLGNVDDAAVVIATSRFALAGVQDKLAVIRDGDALFIPTGSTASTHILKLGNDRWPGLVDNELFMLELARAAGVNVVRAERWKLSGGKPALLVERFDRDGDKRLHQEDFCQALGIGPDKKYEALGGPDLTQLIALVRSVSSKAVDDVNAVLRWQVFNTIAGNADGHAKNLAFLREAKDGVRVAPFYDLVCTRQYKSVAKRLALRVGEVGDPAAILPQHWRACGKLCGVDGDFMIKLVDEMATKLDDLAGKVGDELVMKRGADAAVIKGVTKSVRDMVKTTKKRLAKA